MRSAHSCIFSALLLAMAGMGAPAFAQVMPSALDAHAPTLPLQHRALQASGSIVQQSGDWRQANQAVAEFPRGHADIVQWEAQQSQPQSKPQGQGADNSKAAPAKTHDGHGAHHQHGAKP